jgi:c-di-GMP-binding flagellar brake protein YcgR
MSPESPVVPVRTTNISLGGFVCLTSAALEVGTVLQAKLQLTPHEALDTKAQVVRVDDPPDAPPGHWARVALRFVDLNEARERQIADALAVLGADVDPTGVPKAYRSGAPAR